MNDNESFFLQNKDTMTLTEMEKELGLAEGRMRKIKYDLDKFYFRTKELQQYHKDIEAMGRTEIDEIGDREVGRRLSEKYGVSTGTIRKDMFLMKKYKVI